MTETAYDADAPDPGAPDTTALDPTAYESAVALVGMAGRFPGADDVEGLWRNLLDGVKGLREITDEELAQAGVQPDVAADPRYVRVSGPVTGLELFDAPVFGFSPQEAEAMEPQHRLFLECAWEALERAGYCPTQPGGRSAFTAVAASPTTWSPTPRTWRRIRHRTAVRHRERA